VVLQHLCVWMLQKQYRRQLHCCLHTDWLRLPETNTAASATTSRRGADAWRTHSSEPDVAGRSVFGWVAAWILDPNGRRGK
jgi:hypothetical protein